MSHHQEADHPRKRRRLLPLAWGASALAAVVLVLGVNGTLSSWTSAIIQNSNNTVATANAVVLKEATGSATCYSNTNATNSSTCATINKYGGTATPLTPGGTPVTVDVTFSNVGTGAAGTFVLTPGTCSQTPTASATPPGVGNLCTNGDLTVAISCKDGATYGATGTAWTDLAYSAGAPGSIPATLTHTATLAVNASWTCRFTLALNANANPSDSAITVSQALTWTLNA